MRFAVSLALAGAIMASAAPLQKIFPFTYDQHDFENGLRLITVPTDYPNVVALYVVVQAGSRNEVEPGKSGFAHFFEHMMFRGTKLFPPEKWQATMKRAGAATNAYTSDDLTVYHATFSREDLDSILSMEADRFQNLQYPEAAFRTEALAVLGEYNKNSASPTSKLYEVLRDTAFDKHTYKHTTMGFLADIKDMPNQFQYSKQFFERFYRPEYTTVLVVGDVQPEKVRASVAKHWSGWKRGEYQANVPAEPPPKVARTNRVAWPSATLPWIAMGYRAPAYSDSDKEYAALDLIGSIGFSENSDLYKKLVIKEQKVDALFGGIYARVDPYLFTILARIKNPADVDSVQSDVLATLNSFKDTLVSSERLDNVKKRLRYEFALNMDNSEAIASTLARFVALRRTPETINRLFEVYASITPDDLQAAAKKYFVENGRTIVTLTGGEAK
jgi:zinc protease